MPGELSMRNILVAAVASLLAVSWFACGSILRAADARPAPQAGRAVLAWVRFVDAEESYDGAAYLWLGKFNVNVNCVAPGMVLTEMAANLAPEFLNAAVKETVLGRIAASEDVADVVAFFCSDRSRHVTGEVIKVDGGQYI